VTPGVRIAPDGVTFTVVSRDATGLELCLFEGEQERRLAMARTDDFYHITMPDVSEGQRYGYRASGPWAPQIGQLFDNSKLLIDPAAVALDRRFVFDPRLAERGVDTAAIMPKSVVTKAFETAHRPSLFRPGGLIYEINVRGFTKLRPDIPESQRGTIAALAHPAVLSHLRKLGVNAVELMPVVAWIDERHLAPLGLRNAWGYNPVVPMALDPGLAPGGIAELQSTVEALHAQGIAVILDLVLNHTGESDALGPTLSMRGLDSRYYARAPDGALINDTGTGNTLNAGEPLVRQLVLDTLRHFVRHCGVDGFRFDLATVLARGPGFDPKAPIFAEIASDPLLSDRLLIAEPWDVGPGGYQLGNFPATWLEWNDRYRDDVRRFWRGDAGTLGTLATRIMGSSDIFSGTQSRSVNYLASHDGFTLADLVSFRERHNDANGENNRDGQTENFSWNNGAEGPIFDSTIRARRDQDVRALLSTLFASRGTIMLSAGDEFGHSKNGNNNAYAQDNAITWLDWEKRDRSLEDFVAELARKRAARPQLGTPQFLRDAEWRGLDGMPMTSARWERPDEAGFFVSLPEDIVLQINRRKRLVEWP